MRVLLFIAISIVCNLSMLAQVTDVEKGDILTVNGVKGIVFIVDDSGCHGTIMSIKAFRGMKNLFCSKASLLKDLSMSSTLDGKANTEELFSYVSSRNINLAEFPVFNWCKSLGDGWYIPSVEQLKTFVNYWLGNDDLEVDWGDEDSSQSDDSSVPHTKRINDIMMEAGGIPFLNGVFSSTISKNKKVSVFEYNKIDGTWGFSDVSPNKIDKYSVGRAFYDF